MWPTWIKHHQITNNRLTVTIFVLFFRRSIFAGKNPPIFSRVFGCGESAVQPYGTYQFTVLPSFPYVECVRLYSSYFCYITRTWHVFLVQVKTQAVPCNWSFSSFCETQAYCYFRKTSVSFPEPSASRHKLSITFYFFPPLVSSLGRTTSAWWQCKFSAFRVRLMVHTVNSNLTETIKVSE